MSFATEPRDLLADVWGTVFEANGVRSFDDLWDREEPWVDEPNRGRGGWSGVRRLELVGTDGAPAPIYVKVQENYLVRSLRHPLGEMSCSRELRSIRRLADLGVRTLDPVYHGERRVGGRRRAILVTEALPAQLRPLSELAAGSTPRWRSRVLPAVARVVRRLHTAGLQHRSLYPKHVYVADDGERVDVRLIDLEKVRSSGPRAARLRDLDSFNRRARGWSRTDRLRFLREYLEGSGEPWRDLWRTLAVRWSERRERAGDVPG